MSGLAQLLALGSALNVPPEPNSTIDYRGPLAVNAEFITTVAQKNDAFASVWMYLRPNGTITLESTQGFFGPLSGTSTELTTNEWFRGATSAPLDPTIGTDYEVRFTLGAHTKTPLLFSVRDEYTPTQYGVWLPIYEDVVLPPGTKVSVIRIVQLIVRGLDGGGSFYANLQVELRKISDPTDYKSYTFYLSAAVQLT